MRWLRKRSYYAIGRVPTTTLDKLKCRVINGRRAASRPTRRGLASTGSRFDNGALLTMPLPSPVGR
jgi:hypothetical protein